MTERESASAVRLAAMIPARRAVCSGSPFLRPHRCGSAGSAAARHRDSPAGDGLARGDRLCADIDHPDGAAGVDVRQARARLRLPAPTAHSAASPWARKNDRLSSDTVKSTLFNFTSWGTFNVPGREIQDRLHAGADDGVDHSLRRISRHRNHRQPIRSRRTMRRKSRISKIGTPPRDCWPIFSRIVSNSAAISNPSARKPG